MNTMRSGFRLLTKNLIPLILFEVAYKLLCAAVFAPALIGLFNLSLFMSGYRYLSEGRLFSYITHPATIVLLIIILFGITLITLLEMSSVIYCFHASYHNQRISTVLMFRHGYETMRSFFRRGSLPLVVFIVFVIPLTNITVVSGYFSTFKIPDFIMYAIKEHPVSLWCFFVSLFLLVLLAIRWCYSIHSYSLDRCCYKQARKNSRRLTRRHYIKTVCLIFVWNILVFLFLLLLCGLLAGAYILFYEIFLPAKLIYSSVLSFFTGTIQIVFSAYSALSVPISFAFLSARYYIECEDAGLAVPDFIRPEPLFHQNTAKTILAAAVIAAGAVNLIFFGQITDIQFFAKQNILSAPAITAHRGDSVHAPENTLSAFQSAIDNGADCIELDVAQTKDGVTVVTHDTNLKRVTGRNINIWDITYEELKTLDAGSWFGSAYDGERIPSLDEVMDLCRGKIRLNIELKPTGHEMDYEEGVLSVIENHHFKDDCIIASKNIAALKKIKQLNPDITTIYLMTVAYGNLAEMDFADGFSIESSFLSATLVSHIHDAGKTVYAWTVNSESDMERMLRLGVDSLITDNTIKAKETFFSRNVNDTIVAKLRNMFPSMP